MCLSTVTKIYPESKKRPRKVVYGWKVFRKDSRGLHTADRNFAVSLNRWQQSKSIRLRATYDYSSYPSSYNSYPSGFHAFKSRDAARVYKEWYLSSMYVVRKVALSGILVEGRQRVNALDTNYPALVAKWMKVLPAKEGR